jgi:hypothetical protein
MVQVGLYGNTMDHDYKAYSTLVMNNTWYKKRLGAHPLFQYKARVPVQVPPWPSTTR